MRKSISFYKVILAENNDRYYTYARTRYMAANKSWYEQRELTLTGIVKRKWWFDLAPRAFIYFWYLKGGGGGAYSRQGAYFFFEKQPNVQNKTLIIFKKRGDNRNCNSINIRWIFILREKLRRRPLFLYPVAKSTLHWTGALIERKALNGIITVALIGMNWKGIR